MFWLQQGEERLRVLFSLSQPLTADQIAHRAGKSRSSVSEHLRQMRVYGVVRCLNPRAHQSRVYWLTDEGRAHREALTLLYKEPSEVFFPDVDWHVHGGVCFRHRRAVLLALKGRMRPPQVKRKALANDAGLRASVDNIREVLYWLLERGVVRAVRPRGRRFVFYELTKLGGKCQELLRRASQMGLPGAYRATTPRDE